jgi:hypothetical protein
MADPAWLVAACALAAAGCIHASRSSTLAIPTPSVQVGACGEPGRDGVISNSPKLEHADRDLDGDGTPEAIVVDRNMCTGDGNCFWNVFTAPHATGECARYVGTFAASALESQTSKGDDNMRDVRGYWNLHGGRMLLQSYRFTRGGYQIVDVLLCKRASDDRLDCSDSDR